MVTAHFVAKDRVAAAFQIREWWALLRVNKIGYFTAWVVTLGLISVAAIALNFVYYTVVLCCLVPLLAAPVSFYLLLVTAALFGQTYWESTEMLTPEHALTSH